MNAEAGVPPSSPGTRLRPPARAGPAPRAGAVRAGPPRAARGPQRIELPAKIARARLRDPGPDPIQKDQPIALPAAENQGSEPAQRHGRRHAAERPLPRPCAVSMPDRGPGLLLHDAGTATLPTNMQGECNARSWRTHVLDGGRVRLHSGAFGRGNSRGAGPVHRGGCGAKAGYPRPVGR